MTSRTNKRIHAGTRRMGKKAVATAALMAFAGAALVGANPAFADGPNGGSGGTTGGNLGAAGNLGIRYAFFDDAVANPQGGQALVSQGWGQDSINWFMDKAGISGTYMANQFQISCGEALNEAIARGQAAGGSNVTARVVGIMYATNNGNNGGAAARSAQFFYDKAEEWRTDGYPGMHNRSAEIAGFIYNLAQTGVGKASGLPNDGNAYGEPYVSTACVAVNSEEPQGISTPPTYDLTVTTDHASTVTEAGSTVPVYDTIHASRGGKGVDENVDAEVVLTYEGPEGNKSVTKTVSIVNNGDTKSPEFTPADFGWTSWPATGEGKSFWFDVKVAKQGNMNEAVDTADREASESWTVKPKNPVKVLTNGETGSGLTEKDVLAANMFYNANITAHSNGYASQLTITDTVNTADVVIGDKETDNPDRVQVLGPNGQRVKADVTIDRSVEGKVVISGTVKDIVDQGNYTLMVPTYTKATGADYRIPDDSKVCYTEAQDHCLVGNSAETGKVTPDPDKVWTADEAQARTTADPERTNQKGVDQKTFLPGDKVSAVVNDHIAAYLQYGLEEYSITDDWSDGLTYVTMDGAPKVYFQGQDVTDLFEITNDTAKGVTTAKAKPEFLAKTARLTEPGEVKLVISGQFRRDYDTDGQNKQLINKGSVTWNNESKATNEPPIFTVTPKPAIDVEKFTLSEGLEAGDRDEADNALTLASAKDETQIGFLVTNTGEADLVNVSLTDATHEGTTGNVTGIVCEIPAEQVAADPANAGVTGGATAQTVKVAGDKIGTLKVGQSVSCVGTLTGVEEGTLHSDTATVVGESIHNGKKVTDSDDWHAKVDSPATPAPKGAVTGEVAGANTGLMAALGGLMAAIGLGGGATWFARRKAHVAAKH
jgi:hypothetical protein